LRKGLARCDCTTTCGLFPSLSVIWSVRPSPISTVVIRMIGLSLPLSPRCDNSSSAAEHSVWASQVHKELLAKCLQKDVPGRSGDMVPSGSHCCTLLSCSCDSDAEASCTRTDLHPAPRKGRMHTREYCQIAHTSVSSSSCSCCIAACWRSPQSV